MMEKESVKCEICMFCWYLKKMWFNVVEFSNGFIEFLLKIVDEIFEM